MAEADPVRKRIVIELSEEDANKFISSLMALIGDKIKLQLKV